MKDRIVPINEMDMSIKEVTINMTSNSIGW